MVRYLLVAAVASSCACGNRNSEAVCPGQECTAAGCVDIYTPCTTDSSCPAPGQICRQIGGHPTGFGCTYHTYIDPGLVPCDAGTIRFNGYQISHYVFGYCVGGPPCSGGCKDPAKPVCLTATNLCSPAPSDPSCEQKCPANSILVLLDPSNVFGGCRLADEKCKCALLP